LRRQRGDALFHARVAGEQRHQARPPAMPELARLFGSGSTDMPPRRCQAD
jgi:hypothetical protein